MKLYSFIEAHMEEILKEWEAFAQTQGPAAAVMSDLALRDHAKGILTAIAVDIKTAQNPEEQLQKSQGQSPDEDLKSAASIHGALRHASNFSLLQLSAEFRALRATVLRLWLPEVNLMSTSTIYEMIRFNEAIDQALAESIVTYSARAEDTRELFLAVLGHDLRAPLSTMSMAGDLLTRPSVTAEQVAHVAASVRRSARQMGSMVEDLIGYTSTQLGRGMPIILGSVDIKDVCYAAVEDASATHPGRKFDLDTQGDLNGSFDAVRLQQLLTNLMVNAALYGAKESAVIVAARGEPEAIIVKVTNYGAPIPPESIQSIFQPLVQLPVDHESETRPRTSLGLGLFIAREIATAQGGALTVTSSAEDGTTFTLHLPRVAHAH